MIEVWIMYLWFLVLTSDLCQHIPIFICTLYFMLWFLVYCPCQHIPIWTHMTFIQYTLPYTVLPVCYDFLYLLTDFILTMSTYTNMTHMTFIQYKLLTLYFQYAMIYCTYLLISYWPCQHYHSYDIHWPCQYTSLHCTSSMLWFIVLTCRFHAVHVHVIECHCSQTNFCISCC